MIGYVRSIYTNRTVWYLQKHQLYLEIFMDVYEIISSSDRHKWYFKGRLRKDMRLDWNSNRSYRIFFLRVIRVSSLFIGCGLQFNGSVHFCSRRILSSILSTNYSLFTVLWYYLLSQDNESSQSCATYQTDRNIVDLQYSCPYDDGNIVLKWH